MWKVLTYYYLLRKEYGMDRVDKFALFCTHTFFILSDWALFFSSAQKFLDFLKFFSDQLFNTTGSPIRNVYLLYRLQVVSHPFQYFFYFIFDSSLWLASSFPCFVRFQRPMACAEDL